LDGYFQEVYLDLASQPIFNKLVKQVSSDVLDNYVTSLQGEVKKYVSGSRPNYGKAAKRMYNVFRLTGEYESAALLRELFDEPAAILYQVHSLTGTVQNAMESNDAFDHEQLLDQIESLIMMVIRVLEGEKEVEIVRYMLRLHRFINQQQPDGAINDHILAAQAEILNLVNNFFYAKMTALPSIKRYIDTLNQT
jgi:nucleoside diphosphate kinase